jgi:hypothetical protein
MFLSPQIYQFLGQKQNLEKGQNLFAVLALEVFNFLLQHLFF